jgi:hypothetical protein
MEKRTGRKEDDMQNNGDVKRLKGGRYAEQ